MQVEFGVPTSLVEIDAIGASAESYGRIEAYDAAGNLIDRFTTTQLSNGQVTTMRVESASSAIASVRIGGHANTSVKLDNLRFGPRTQGTTQAQGQFAFAGLPTGNYLVKATPPGGYAPAANGGGQRLAAVTAGAVTGDVDFAFRVSGNSWQNPQNRLDVNSDQVVSALDVLLIVNAINQHGGPRDLAVTNYQAPPYIDVNADGVASALDALLIVNSINATGDTAASGGAAEGEAATVLSSNGPAAAPLAGDRQVPVSLPVDRLAESWSEGLLRRRSLVHDQALLAAIPAEWDTDVRRGGAALLSFGPGKRARS
jgi:hypothetical protein